MYWCESCGAVEADIVTDRDTGYREAVCPVCGAYLEDEANLCDCGNWKKEENYACEECTCVALDSVMELYKTLESRGLTEDTITGLIDSCEGEVIYDLRRFKKS